MPRKPIYNPKKIEKKRQKEWEEKQVYKVKSPKSKGENKRKFYALVEFPYPSGEGLHVGHVKGQTAVDVFSRFKRMQGYNVLNPMGYDAFGLPAENFAIKNGKHPATFTQRNINNFIKQQKSFGPSFDWSRTVDTTDPEYYKWTQWIFLQLFKAGLAYEKEAPINWCPSCKCGLANEEVVGGKCERCDTDVVKKNLKQWFLAITKYADRLISDLDDLDWPEYIKTSQKNWIGRKEGIEITYDVLKKQDTRNKKDTNDKSQKNFLDQITVFTTRPDTNFGATFIALAPEHDFVKKILDKEIGSKEGDYDKIKEYVEVALNKSEVERQAEEKKKTGVFTGFYAKNNLNGRNMPIWISDFVLTDFGTGALVGVPGHDTRDFEFAKKFDLDVIRVVVGKDGDDSEITKLEQVQEEEGKMVNSDFLNGMDIHDATTKIMDYMEEKEYGKRVISYKLRDWLFSRQRYWGEPIPIVKCKKCGNVPLDEKDLPLLLPGVEKYEPTGTGESPLAAVKDWVNTKCPKCGGDAKRETNTMPQWAGSSWYFLRFMDPHNKKAYASKEALDYFAPVDIYFGGAEHTTVHLLYSRFWTKALYDLGHCPVSEPFHRRVQHGMILAEDNRKMSKRWGNVIDPLDVINKYGADTMRTYIMFMGPYSDYAAWSTASIEGINRFMKRIYEVCTILIDNVKRKKIERKDGVSNAIHSCIKKVSKDIEKVKYHTAISQLMIFFNGKDGAPDWRGKINGFGDIEEVSDIEKNIDIDAMEKFLKLLSPFAPHVTEELWAKLGHETSIHLEKWPNADENKIKAEAIELVVQINGKVRAKIQLEETEIDEERAKEIAMENKKIQQYLEGKEIRKAIFVRGKLLNIVI